LGQAFELKGMPDSALAAYRKSLALDPSDTKGTLLVAKAMVDQATYDTAAANRLKSDSAQLRAFRAAFADRLDSAHALVSPSLTSPDSAQQLSAAVILLTGGSKLAQAAAYDRAYAWLDEALRIVAPRSRADTTGPRFQVRVQASFWFGIASVASLQEPYRRMVASKSCADAKTIHTRLVRTREALVLGARVSPSFANTMLQNLAKFEAVMPQVKKQFKCNNF
jgi:tetratricopeptide (TPR) repeat protein